MIPKGAVWQYLRQAALSAIPADTSFSLNHHISLSQWHAQGYYKVRRVEPRGFELEVPTVDIGGALLADAEHLLDAATEHQVFIWKNINDQNWSSSAWLTVTFYYWAFFLLLALTRLIGRSTWYLGQKSVQNLRLLAMAGSAKPGQGCFRIELGPSISITERQLYLRKRASRMHDELWRHWGGICADELAPLLKGTANSMEDRLYAAIVRANNALGAEWPSTFRNSVNYHQGFAYSAIRRVKVLTPYSYLRKPVSYEFEKIVEGLERRASFIRRDSVEKVPEEIAKLLVDYTFVIHSLVTELHSEILDRRHIDVRWRNARQHFREQNGLTSAKGSWPT